MNIAIHNQLYMYIYIYLYLYKAFFFRLYIYEAGPISTYLASPPDGATIAREIYFRVVQSATIEISTESDSQFHFDRMWRRARPRILEK